MEVNGIKFLSKKPGDDGLYPVEFTPLSGDPVEFRLSAGAIADVQGFKLPAPEKAPPKTAGLQDEKPKN